MQNQITHLTYNKKENLSRYPQLPELIQNHDQILIYDSNCNTQLIQQYQELTKGILTPSQIQSSQSSAFLNILYRSKKIIYPLNPPADLSTHTPYFKHKQSTISKETEISSDFIMGDFLTALSKAEYAIQTYKYSFMYLYSYLHNVLENNEQIIQHINQNLAYQDKKILIISNPNLLEYKFMYPHTIHQQILSDSGFGLSIRHEIFRREILNLDITENLHYGYILESTLKNLKRTNKIDYCREQSYCQRSNFTQITFESMLELSHLLSEEKTAHQQINKINDFLEHQRT